MNKTHHPENPLNTMVHQPLPLRGIFLLEFIREVRRKATGKQMLGSEAPVCTRTGICPGLEICALKVAFEKQIIHCVNFLVACITHIHKSSPSMTENCIFGSTKPFLRTSSFLLKNYSATQYVLLLALHSTSTERFFLFMNGCLYVCGTGYICVALRKFPNRLG